MVNEFEPDVGCPSPSVRQLKMFMKDWVSTNVPDTRGICEYGELSVKRKGGEFDFPDDFTLAVRESVEVPTLI